MIIAMAITLVSGVMLIMRLNHKKRYRKISPHLKWVYFWLSKLNGLFSNANSNDTELFFFARSKEDRISAF